VFCSFLALLLRKELIDRLVAAGRQYEWADIIRDLDQLVQPTSIKPAEGFACAPALPVAPAPCSSPSVWRCRR
jgi:hypothetical protein